jgi:hypothetical protein
MTSTTYWDTVIAAIRYQVDGDALGALLPPGFSLRSPEVMATAMMNRGVEWMAGEPYNLLAVNVPVTFTTSGGRDDHIDGWYCLVVWENKATPILTGREQTGIPKVYGEVEDFRFLGDEMRTWAHYGGHSFCDLAFTSIRPADADERTAIDAEFAEMNWMGWRHLPKLGPDGGAALSHPTLFPQEFLTTRVRLASATIDWSVPPLWKNPTQLHIISALAGLPVGDPIGPAFILEARNNLRGDLARVLV